MKNSKYILFTAGRGPRECGLAVHGVQKQFRKYLEELEVKYEIINQQNGDFIKSIETIVFRVNVTNYEVIKPWIGSVQWVCKSPIRKMHKRKNWFIKCEEIFINEEVKFNRDKVKVQSFRASGPGGQHRNKVETAIRLIHEESGMIVTATDGKSQAQNKKKAWIKLEEMIKQKNTSVLKNFNTDQWTSQLEIERDKPVKTFRGIKFKEEHG